MGGEAVTLRMSLRTEVEAGGMASRHCQECGIVLIHLRHSAVSDGEVVFVTSFLSVHAEGQTILAVRNL